ncbi:hypothetical protein F4826_004803 [Rahnella inusitata]|nr:hypothetical protein [Rahnella inusitata]
MKQQAYPTSKIKVGTVLYSAFVWNDDDTGISHVVIDQWHISSIQNKKRSLLADEKEMRVNIVKSEHVTWESGAWKGSIASDYRHKIWAGEDLPRGIYTTPSAALRYAMDEKQKTITWYGKKIGTEVWNEEYQAEYKIALKEHRLLKSKLTRLKTISVQRPAPVAL